jgi:hypothetical protein
LWRAEEEADDMSQTQASRATDVERAFPGPRPFESAEQQQFFGRASETAVLRDLVGAYRDVVLYAQSGVGKSSIVNAGLIPLLIADEFAVVTTRVWRADVTGSGKPDSYVSAALQNARYTGGELNTSGALTLVELVATSKSRGTVLIIDQFEEIFLGGAACSAAREHFFSELRSALSAVQNFRLLLVLREEYLASLEDYAGSVPNEFEIRYQLGALSVKAAKLAIIGPLEAVRIGIDKAVVDDIIVMLRRGPSSLSEADTIEPLHLQLVCRRLVTRLGNGNEITEEHVASSGDVDEILTSFYEEQVRQASARFKVPEAQLRRWFDDELTTPTGSRGVTRVGRGVASQELLNFLQNQHVIRADTRAGAIWYELTHDRFVAPIRKANTDWLEKRSARALVWKLVISGALVFVAALGTALVSWTASRQVILANDGLTKVNVMSSYYAARALEDRRFGDAIESARNCAKAFERIADYQERRLEQAHEPLPPIGNVAPEQRRQILARGTLNDGALCYYILGRAEEALNRQIAAKQAYERAKGYTYARTWDPKGWFWSPSEAAKKRLENR